ncbi:MAG: PEP-CTERM sorting domain-containing protein [Pontiellaceae bacterium]|nr:PEP-CTERM sorting domain-containing protein [Pontiellaceae bacterium]MBN2785156.1 PEP-CTERM sorting domain-containing protein [Pontiellaceae bacterium]
MKLKYALAGLIAGLAVTAGAGLVTATFDELPYLDNDAIAPADSLDGLKFLGSTGLGMIYEAVYGQDGSNCLYTDYDNGVVASLSITRDDASVFQLVSMYLDDEISSGSQYYKIEGYLDGNLEYQMSDVDVWGSGYTVSFTGWGNLDEVLITATSEGENGYDVAALIDTVTYETIPEPATMAFIGVFGIGTLAVRRIFMM